MLRRRRDRERPRTPRAVDAARWNAWCARVLATRRPEHVRELLAELRAAQAAGPPQDRAAALDALAVAPAPLLLLLDRHARPNTPAPPLRDPERPVDLLRRWLSNQFFQFGF